MMTSFDPVLEDKGVIYPLTLVILGIRLKDEIQYLREKYSQSDVTLKPSPALETAQKPKSVIGNPTNHAAGRMSMLQTEPRHAILSYASGMTTKAIMPDLRGFTETYTVQPRIHGVAGIVNLTLQSALALKLHSSAFFWIQVIHRSTYLDQHANRSVLIQEADQCGSSALLWLRKSGNPEDIIPPTEKILSLFKCMLFKIISKENREDMINMLRFITAFDIISDDLILRAKTETNDEVSLPKVKFGAVVDTDILEWPTFYDGIMGLGTHLDGDELLTMLERGIRHEILACPTFEVNISFSSVSKVWDAPKTIWQTGTVSFGTRPSSHYNRVKVLENTNWKIPSHRKKIGDVVFTMTNTITIDTGTYGIYIKDEDAVNAFYRDIPGASQDEDKIWHIPSAQASNHSSWPKLAIELGNGDNARYLEIYSRNLSYFARSSKEQFLEGVLQTTSLLGDGHEDLELLGVAGIACTRMLFLYDITPWEKIRPWTQPYQDKEGKPLEPGNWIYWKEKEYV
ncbi:hypothetical protein J132_09450 [Termitomyces sp. J132]|nr:hypothetical protein J132_09450 [Termitomyces sp. J132]